MAVITRNPMLFDPFRMFDHAFAQTFSNEGPTAGFVPALDVRELDDEYVVLVDLPGVKSGDVNVELNNQTLTISGTRVPYEAGKVQQLERPYGAFSRRLTLARGIDPDGISAEYEDGVLALHITKPEPVKPKKIAISEAQTRAAD